MENNKKHLIFDLDDTIWDYQQNSKEALNELYSTFKLEEQGILDVDFLNTFRSVNGKLWDDYDKGIISRDVIRKQRFPKVFEKLSLKINGEAMQMQESFMKVCSTKPGLVRGVKQVLEQFRGKYKFHILSNGFDEIQFIKLKSSGVDHFFDKVITSGRAGFRKPQPEIFEFALNEIGASKNECVMIGDNPVSDIEGAYNYGIDQIYFNTHKKSCAIAPTHTIINFDEILTIL